MRILSCSSRYTDAIKINVMMVTSKTANRQKTIIFHPELVHVTHCEISLLYIIHEESVARIPTGLKSVNKDGLNQRICFRAMKSHSLSAFHIRSGLKIDPQDLIELGTNHLIHFIVRILAIVAVSGI